METSSPQTNTGKNQNLLQAKATASQYSVTNITSQAAPSEFWISQVRARRGWKQESSCRKGPANSPLPLHAQSLAAQATSPTTGMAVCLKIILQRSASQTA